MVTPAVRTVLLGKAFNPLSIPGLGLWYDAADASTLTYDGSNRVSSWANKSGRANCAATKSVDANKPTFEAAGLNGKPSLRFTAASIQYLTIGAGALGLTNNVPGATLMIVEKRVGSGLSQGAFFISTGTSAASSRFFYYIATNNTRNLIGRTKDTDAGAGATFGGSSPSVEIVTAVDDYSVGVASGYVNGALVNSGALTSSGNTSATDSLAMTIGRSDAASPFDGYISEILFWPRALSAAERAPAHRYLSKKWGAALAA